MDSTTNHILVQLTMARRLLLLNTPTPPPATPPPPPAAASDSTFDANVVMVLSVLLCALICSLGLNSIIRCALRCSHLVPAGQLSTTSGGSAATRLANTGIKKKALKTFPVVTFSDGGLNLDAECVICLSEFAAGDRVKILPKCNHGFHVKCIDKWLGSHSSCPTCRHCLIDTCRKIVGAGTPAPATVVVGAATGSSEVSSPHLPPPSVPQPPPLPAAAALVEGAVVISMPPLEQEDLVRSYRGAS
ncbi:RING-H2 finger protein ATL78 [Linum grandiflorum]